MVTDICTSPNCEFHECCRMRTAAKASTVTDESPTTPSLNLAGPVLNCSDRSVNLTVRLESVGWVGIMRVQGEVDHRILPALHEVDSALPTLAGFFVVYNCPGGTGAAGALIEHSILRAVRFMPVVSYIYKSCSTSLLPHLAAMAAYGASWCESGAFGNLRGYCNGREPSMIVNSQSPRKFDGGPLPWPPDAFGDDQERARLQRRADGAAERDLRAIAAYTGKTVAELRPYLDGRILDAEEALAAGLIRGICHESEAYEKLLSLIKKGEENGH